MEHIALARKWRPRVLSDVIGQDSAVQVLTNSFNNNKLHHAYLFTGTRGVGKTTLARIFAKIVNCENVENATPCLKCENCIAIENGCFPDFYEIDGASKTKVEDVREIIENIAYAPLKAKIKIYLIDEVHMLSISSFNALLKTLEEPPSYVKFLFATTEVHKIPATILSRSIQLNLKPLPAHIIQKQLEFILTKENISFETSATKLVAGAAFGSMRDGLNILEQAIMHGNNAVQLDTVKALIGCTKIDYAQKLLSAIATKNIQECMLISDNIAKENAQFIYVIEELQVLLHNICLNKLLGKKDILDIINKISLEDLQLYYQISLKSVEDINLAPDMKIGFEMMLMRMIAFTLDNSLENHSYLGGETNIVNNMVKPAEDIIASAKKTEEKRQDTKSLQLDKPNNKMQNDWAAIIESCNWNGLTKTAAQAVQLLEIKDNAVVINIDPSYSYLLTDNITRKIENDLKDFYKKDLKLIVKSAKIKDNSIIGLEKQKLELKAKKATDALSEDDFFNKIQNTFALQGEHTVELLEKKDSNSD